MKKISVNIGKIVRDNGYAFLLPPIPSPHFYDGFFIAADYAEPRGESILMEFDRNMFPERKQEMLMRFEMEKQARRNGSNADLIVADRESILCRGITRSWKENIYYLWRIASVYLHTGSDGYVDHKEGEIYHYNTGSSKKTDWTFTTRRFPSNYWWYLKKVLEYSDWKAASPKYVDVVLNNPFILEEPDGLKGLAAFRKKRGSEKGRQENLLKFE